MTQPTLLDPSASNPTWTTGVYLDPLEVGSTWNIGEFMELMKVNAQDTLSANSITLRTGEAYTVIEVPSTTNTQFVNSDPEKPEILSLNTTVFGKIKNSTTISYGTSALKAALSEGAVYEVEVSLVATMDTINRQIAMQPAPVKYLFSGWEEFPQGKGYLPDADRSRLIDAANAEMAQIELSSFMPSFSSKG